MAKRKVFIPNLRGEKYIKEYDIEFKWSYGNSIKNTQESIRRMHTEIKRRYNLKVLCEISSASKSPFERLLSAFQLPIKIGDVVTTVECAYQGSKVFVRGGPYQDLYLTESRKAKKDTRLSSSGKLIGFRLGDVDYSVEPMTAFYDMLYISALQKFIKANEISNNMFLRHFMVAEGFTDIYFNPPKSINCQAKSLALFISLSRRQIIDKDIEFLPYGVFSEEPSESEELNSSG